MKMKNFKILMLSISLALMGGFTFAQNGLENVIVEKYYVSNAADSIGSTGILPVGSVTYRVFVDMLPGYNFQALYGVAGHTLTVQTTTTFFNNENYGGVAATTSATNVRKETAMLDSYFSVGAAANGRIAVVKSEDTNGSTGNAQGLLQNNVASMNGPINIGTTTNSGAFDGMITGTVNAVTFVGINNTGNGDLGVLDGTSQVGGLFTTANGSVASLTGSTGATTTNKVLVGQFTTDGIFSFTLNVQLGTPSSGIQNFVATSPVGSEITIPSLTFISTPPAPTATSSLSYCQGSTAAQLTATAMSGNTLMWYTVPTGGTGSTTAPTPSTSVATTLNYYVSQVNSIGNESSRTLISVVINAAPSTPTITAGSATTFCTGGSVVLTSSSANGNIWSKNGTPIGGATAQTYTATVAGTYTVVASTGGCSSLASAGTTVTINALPVATINAASLNICAGVPDILIANVTGGSGVYTTYTWAPGAHPNNDTANFSSATAGLKHWRVIATDNNGCSSLEDTIAVTVNALPSTPVITAGGATTFCTGGSVVLTSSSANGNQWSMNGTPIGGATSQTYTATAAGAYTVMVTTTGCSSLASAGTTVSVSANFNIVATTGANGTISPIGTTAVCSGANQTYTITPNGGFNIADVLVDGVTNAGAITNGTFTFTGVITTHTIDVTFGTGCGSVPPTPVIAGPNAICTIVHPVYTATATTATTYTWVTPVGMTINSGQGTSSITTTVTGNSASWTVTCSGTNSCGTSATSSLIVTKKPQTRVLLQDQLTFAE